MKTNIKSIASKGEKNGRKKFFDLYLNSPIVDEEKLAREANAINQKQIA